MTTRSTEISFQQRFRPQLNHPWINPLLRRRGLHRPQYNIPTTRQGPIGITRLHRHHRRLERRHAQECLYWIFTFLRLRTFFTSYIDSGVTPKRSFTPPRSQTLRSHSASTEILYLRWSQHFHIDEPWRSRASAQLKLIFRFRKLMLPPTQATLRLFQLSRDFLHRCRRFFREFLQLNSQLFPPLQVPASPIIEVKTHTLEHYIFTFRHFLCSGLLMPLRNAFATGSDPISLDALTPDMSSDSLPTSPLHHLLRKTFIPSPTTSTPVFQPLRHGILLIKTRLRELWPPHLLQRYRWGLHWDRRLPSAYILPKHSRDWNKARPIVSYTQTVSAPLSQTVASAFYCLLQVVFPELTSLSDVLPLLRHIWRLLQSFDTTDDLFLYQQDIAGFFNFVTRPRMISTVEFLITRYARYASLQGLDLRDDPILSVAQHQQERLQRIFRGRSRKASRSYHPIYTYVTYLTWSPTSWPLPTSL